MQLQRWIVHVQRQGLSWCRTNPKRTDAKHLRELLHKLTEVKTEKESERFIEGFMIGKEDLEMKFKILAIAVEFLVIL